MAAHRRSADVAPSPLIAAPGTDAGRPAQPVGAVPEAKGTRPGRFLPQIQALRAVAVLLVVVYHLKPAKLSGGYVGVDVFFVISGYLMTAHLIRRSGPGVSIPSALGEFYTRRIRRILPASLTVLTVVALLTVATVSRVEWDGYFREIRASALYYENWSLASSSADYLGGALTSPVQHFWSLSVEEQFYLGWPVLLLLAGAFASVQLGRRVQLAVMVLVLVASLAYSIYATQNNAAPAYFNTVTRLWEFAVGGLVAALSLVGRIDRHLAALSAWVGLALIAASAYIYTGNTPFPGSYAAVPVVGAALVIASGERSAAWGPHAIFRWRPVQYLGDISYSVYLWHFPLIVLWINHYGAGLHAKAVLILFVLSLVLGAASKRFVEDPLRGPHAGKPGLRAVNRAFGGGRAYPVAVAMMVPPVVIASVALHLVSVPTSHARTVYAAVEKNLATQCLGAETLNGNQPGCSASTVTLKQVTPSPLIAQVGFAGDCQQTATRSSVLTCTYGSRAAGATRVALVGDSHATQWIPALSIIATQRRWRITTYLKSGCAFSTSNAVGPSCEAWNRAVTTRLAAARYAFVIVGARNAFAPLTTASVIANRVAGLVAAWHSVERVGSRVIALRDVPQPLNGGIGSVPTCVYDHADASACSFAQAAGERYELVSAAAALDRSAPLIDLNANLCQDGRCPAVIGNVLVYIDDSHITSLFAQSLRAPLSAALVAAGMPAGG